MTRHFVIGFLVGTLLFLAINLLSAHVGSDCGLPAVFGQDACADDIARAGWPLRFYEEGGLAYRRDFSPIYLLLNTAVGLGFSILTGWWNQRRKTPLSK
jgi:hypothetical protein